jgi:hypothetical protein
VTEPEPPFATALARFWKASDSLRRELLALTLAFCLGLLAVGAWFVAPALALGPLVTEAVVELAALAVAVGALFYGYLADRAAVRRRRKLWEDSSRALSGPALVPLLAVQLPQWEEDAERRWRGAVLLSLFVGFLEGGPVAAVLVYTVGGWAVGGWVGPSFLLAEFLGLLAGSLLVIIGATLLGRQRYLRVIRAGDAIREEAGRLAPTTMAPSSAEPSVSSASGGGALADRVLTDRRLTELYEVLEHAHASWHRDSSREWSWLFALGSVFLVALVLVFGAPWTLGYQLLGLGPKSTGVPSDLGLAMGGVVAAALGLIGWFVPWLLAARGSPFKSAPSLRQPGSGAAAADVLGRSLSSLQGSSQILARRRSLAGFVAAIWILLGLALARLFVSAAWSAILATGDSGYVTLLVAAGALGVSALVAAVYWRTTTRTIDSDEQELSDRSRALSALASEFWTRF